MCSLAAAVQGMDETVNNGAQAIYLKVIHQNKLSEFIWKIDTCIAAWY
jgi:hypothetical protein